MRKFPTFDAIFKRKNEKPKPAEEPQPVNEDEQRLAAVSTVPLEGPDGNDNEPKEDKQLVYAELVLKPSDDKPAPQKPSTEYAEIIYVKKPEQSAGTEAQKDNK